MYKITLKLYDKNIILPVLPESLEISSPGDNETTKVMGIGEINIIRKRSLREFSISSHFPKHDAPYVTGELLEPIEYVKAIQAQRDKLKPLRFSLEGSDLDINIQVSIDDFSYEERGGEVGDIYYTLKLKEWRDYSPRTLDIKKSNNKTKVTVSKVKRSGSPAPKKTHTVVKGDSMWSICKKHYGDGSKYPELYAKNKALIDARNKGKNLPKYTIYSGQVLTL